MYLLCVNFTSINSLRVSFPIYEVAARLFVESEWKVTEYGCHKHPRGVIVGKAPSKSVLTEQKTCPPRVAHIKLLGADKSYDPYTPERSISSYKSIRKNHHEYNQRKHTLHKDVHKSLGKMVELETKMDYFNDVPEPWSGNLHDVQKRPFKTVFYNKSSLAFERVLLKN